MKINSPLRYPGGKSAMTNYIAGYVTAAHKTTYAEPFAGGAGVAINLLLNGTVTDILLNDKDPAIYSIWNNIINETDRFINAIRNTPVTISEYKNQKAFYKTNCNVPSFELGFAAFYLNRTNVSGVITGGPIGGENQSGKYKIDCRFNKDKLIEKIRVIADKKNHIRVYNMDVVDFVNQYVTPDVFTYFDPPYVEKGKVLYKDHMENDAHTRLFRLIQTAAYPWLISYDDCEFINETYKNYSILPVYLNYSAANKGKSKEIIIMPTNTITATTV